MQYFKQEETGLLLSSDKPENMEMSCVPALWGLCCPTICRCTSCPNCIQPCQTPLPSAMLSSHYECGQSLGYPCPMCDWITDATQFITCVLENSKQINCSSTMLSLWQTIGMLRKISPLYLLPGRLFFFSKWLVMHCKECIYQCVFPGN